VNKPRADKALSLSAAFLGIAAVAFFALLHRPYYISRYGVVVSVLGALAGAILCVQSGRGNSRHLPSSTYQWLQLYFGLLLLPGSVFACIASREFAARSYSYDNPYIRIRAPFLFWFDDQEERKDFDQAINKPAPDFAFVEMSTKKVRQLSEFKGNVIVLNFWATWCAPCVAELPSLDSLIQSEGNRGIIVLTLSQEEEHPVGSYLSSHPMRTIVGVLPPWNHALIPYALSNLIPTTYVIDREGILRSFHQGRKNFLFFKQAVASFL